MNDTAAVEVGERSAHLHDEPGESHRHRLAPPPTELRALDAFHGEEVVVAALQGFEVMNARDIRVIELGHDGELRFEEFDTGGVDQCPMHDLQGK